MGARYLTDETACGIDLATGWVCPDWYVGRAWYYDTVSFSPESYIPPQPLAVDTSMANWGPDGGVIRRAIDVPMPDPGYVFGSAIDFGKLSPTTAYGGYIYPPPGAIIEYLNQNFGAALAAYLNADYRGRILSQIAAGNVPEFRTSTLAHRDYLPQALNGQIGWIWDGGTDYLLATPGGITAALATIGASGDPVVQSYLAWFAQAQEAAKQYDQAYQDASDKAFYGSLFAAVGLAVGIGFAIPAIAGAISTGTLTLGTVQQAASLAMKLDSVVGAESFDMPDIPATTLTAQQAFAQDTFVARVEMQATMADANATMQEALALATTDPQAAVVLSKEALDLFGAVLTDAETAGQEIPLATIERFQAADAYITSQLPADTLPGYAADFPVVTTDYATTLVDAGSVADSLVPIYDEIAVDGEPVAATESRNWLWLAIIGGIVATRYNMNRRTRKAR